MIDGHTDTQTDTQTETLIDGEIVKQKSERRKKNLTEGEKLSKRVNNDTDNWKIE